MRRLHPHPTWTLLRRLTALAFLVLLALAARGIAPWLAGSTAATRLLDAVPFVDPLAALEGGLAAGEVTADVLVGAGLLLGAAALLGPVFCGWVCPLGLVLDLNQTLRHRFRRLVRRRRRRETPPRGLASGGRYVLLGLFLGLAAVAHLPVFQAFSPIHLVLRVLLFGALGGLGVLVLLVLAEWIVPRLWCRALCPLGGLYALVGRWAPLRVRLDSVLAGLVPCQRCTIRCPMGIRVMEDYSLAGRRSIDHPDCTRCGSCVDACPRGVLGFGVRSPPREPEDA